MLRTQQKSEFQSARKGASFKPCAQQLHTLEDGAHDRQRTQEDAARRKDVDCHRPERHAVAFKIVSHVSESRFGDHTLDDMVFFHLAIQFVGNRNHEAK